MNAPNRAPTTCWVVRMGDGYPNGYVLTCEGDEIRVTWFDKRNDAQTIFMSRKDARLLAKRINQCLDSTVKR